MDHEVFRKPELQNEDLKDLRELLDSLDQRAFSMRNSKGEQLIYPVKLGKKYGQN